MINDKGYTEPKLRHINALIFYGYNFKEFLLVCEDAESYKFYHVITGIFVTIRR